MKILVDADAAPVAVKEILFRAAQKNSISLILVSNQRMKIPDSEFITSVIVDAGPDEADDRIVETVSEGDLVITSDIPLADRIISLGGFALNPRGDFYTEENIKEKLAMRDLMDTLRSIDINTGSQSPYSNRDRQEFANRLDIFISRYKKSKKTGD